MPDAYTNGPSVTELARRLQRIEDKLDERTATVDMLRSLERSVTDRFAANEKLQEARELGHAASTQAQDTRIGKLESTNSRLTFMLVASFLGLLISIITQVVNATGGQTP